MHKVITQVFVFVSFLMLTACPFLASNAEATPLKSNAKPVNAAKYSLCGDAIVTTPITLVTGEEVMEVTSPYGELEFVPAISETRMKTVVVPSAISEFINIPAVYGTIGEKIIIGPPPKEAKVFPATYNDDGTLETPHRIIVTIGLPQTKMEEREIVVVPALVTEKITSKKTKDVQYEHLVSPAHFVIHNVSGERVKTCFVEMPEERLP
ncbi:MAG: hypothetical protein ACPGVT_03390 [Maricaulaceae bacterium]